MIPSTKHRAFFGALALAAFLTGCSDAPTSVTFDGPVDVSLPWAEAEAAAVGMDAAALRRAADQAAANPRFRSLLVVRRGHLVLERYFGDARRDDLADVRSVTKSVVSTLTGLALAQGHLTSLDQTLGEIVPAGALDLDPVEQSITVRDLLTMSGGWQWTETGSVGYNQWITSGDPLGYLLDRPHIHQPGTTFAYNSASAHLLGVVLSQAVGRSLPSYANEVLLGPMGVTASGWEVLDHNQVNGGAGFTIRPVDMARLGQLFLQDGWSGNRRILPEGWVGQATTAHYPWTSSAGPTRASYGYLWWTDEENDAYMAWGYGGQFIYVAPRRDLVVVTTTTWWRVDGESAPADLSSQVLDVIVNGVLPAAPPD